MRLRGRPVILIGTGEMAAAKRRLLERAGAVVVGEDAQAALAIVVDDEGAVARLKARGVLVNAVDRPDLCDFTLPAIVERGDVIVAVGTGGVSAGLAAALRQRIEAWLPADLGALARALHAARERIRARYPDGGERRRAIGAALAPGGVLDPLAGDGDVEGWLAGAEAAPARLAVFAITSPDPDQLTLAAARALAQADRVYHAPGIAAAILDRARADAVRIAGSPPAELPPGIIVHLEDRR
ncbi:siroheme synthase [Sphingomonas donggukensis]|uniref:precorrin-2 dehydrogenase n=1 Tax=Sphingomonas donggukensis TaxID=2949093 RepID=A0ABY4TXC2_9SPHN|nr:siroheme synthase [Sphingomonas donggukensis]URW77069.1 siroheme synthase [Sphingomonas donggukensis]